MAEYWKSLPKKYCSYCNCWITDNKASVEFHERGLRHKGNVEKKLREIRRSGAKKEQEQSKINYEMAKIEAAALKSFEKDLASDPKLVRELSSVSQDSPSTSTMEQPKAKGGGRFGDIREDEEDESRIVAIGREKAMETITKKLEKKSKWLEAKTAEGQTYYWNKETMETKWKPPKSGYLSLEEQQSMHKNIDPSFIGQGPSAEARYDPYGGWKQVEAPKSEVDEVPDLELPQQKGFLEVPAAVVAASEKEDEIEFKEKTLDTLKSNLPSSSSSAVTFEFKKRKVGGDAKRSLRRKLDDD